MGSDDLADFAEVSALKETIVRLQHAQHNATTLIIERTRDIALAHMSFSSCAGAARPQVRPAPSTTQFGK
jgi:hypothetical protein